MIFGQPSLWRNPQQAAVVASREEAVTEGSPDGFWKEVERDKGRRTRLSPVADRSVVSGRGRDGSCQRRCSRSLRISLKGSQRVQVQVQRGEEVKRTEV